MNKKLALISFLSLIVVVGLMVVGTHKAAAAIITTPATGNVSSDSYAPGASVALPNILITETAPGDIAIGAIVLTAPAGYVFDDTATVDVAYVDVGFTLAGDATATMAPTTLTINISALSTGAATMTIGSVGNPIKVRVSVGCPKAVAGNILMTGGVITGLSVADNFGTLTQVTGTMTSLAVRLLGQAAPSCAAPAGTVTDEIVGVPFSITKIYAVDAYFNTETAYAGAGKVLVYAGPTGVPAYTTVVTFVAGESTTLLVTTLNVAEKKTITVTDVGNFGLPSSLQAVNPVAINDLACLSSGIPGSVYLSWTVPTGTTGAYTAAYSPSPIANILQFAGAFPIADATTWPNGVVGQSSGIQLVTGISPSVIYFFSVRAKGANASISDVSTGTAICTAGSAASSAASVNQVSKPASSITSPVAEASFKAETTITITGSSSDNGVSSVKKVEVSTDGGTTWADATSLTSNSNYGFSWKYDWTGGGEGPHLLKSRATSWTGVVETPGAGITVTILSKSGIVYTGTSTPQQVVSQITSASSVAQIQAAITVLQTQLLSLLQQLLVMLTAQLQH